MIDEKKCFLHTKWNIRNVPCYLPEWSNSRRLNDNDLYDVILNK